MPRKIIFSSGFIFILLIYPIYLMNGDNWDGIHLEFAYLIDDLSGIKTFFFESSWYLQFYVTEFIISLAKYIKLSYFKTNGIIVYFVFVLFLCENYFISKKIFKFNNNQNIWYLIFLSTFPVFSTLSSSIMTFHLVCFTFGLFCLRLIYTTQSFYVLSLSLILLLSSYNFNSLIVFIPALSISYDFLNNKKIKISSRSIFVCLISLIAIILRIFFLNPVGEYENYNSISFTNLIDTSFIQFIKLLIPFISYPIILFLFSLFFILILFSYGLRLHKIQKKRFFNESISIFPIIIIFIFSIISYLIVLKTTNYAWNISWNSRQSILTSIPLGLFIIIYFKNIFNLLDIKTTKKLKFFNFSMLVIVIFNITIFSSFIFKNLNRDIFENKLIESLSSKFKNGLDPGSVVIYGQNIPGSIDKFNNEVGIAYRFYELNYIFYKAFNKRDYFVVMSPSNIKRDNIQDLINKYAQTHENRILYVIGDNLKCHTSIQIDANNFVGKLNIFKNILSLQNPTVKIKKSLINCS